MARIFKSDLLLVIIGLLHGSYVLTESLAEEYGELLNKDSCGKRYYETGKFPIDSRLLEHPWLVRLGYERDGNVSYVFQGLLVHEQFVLTTVHVAQFEDYGQLTYARLGEHNSTTDPDCEENSSESRKCVAGFQDILIDSVIVHPQFNLFEQSNNIALIKLRVPANVNGLSVSTICLNESDDNEPPVLITASWCGRRETGLSSIPKQYYMVKITPQECRDRMPGYTISLVNGTFCVVFDQRHQKDSDEPNLRGANGAPIFSVQDGNRIFLIGLLAYGPRYPAKFHQPYIIMPVAPYISWFTETIMSDLEKQTRKTFV